LAKKNEEKEPLLAVKSGLFAFEQAHERNFAQMCKAILQV